MLLLSLVSCGPELTLDVPLPVAAHGVERDPRRYVLVRDADPCDALAGRAAPDDWGLLLVQVTPDAVSVWGREGMTEVVSLRQGSVADAKGPFLPALYDALVMWREHGLEQQAICGSAPQDELLLALDPGVSIQVLNAVRYTAGQAQYGRQALWVDAPATRPDPGLQPDDGRVQVAMLGTSVQVSTGQRSERGDDDVGAMATRVLGQGPDCARVVPFDGATTGDLVHVLDGLVGAGAHRFMVSGTSDALAFEVPASAETQPRTWSLDTPLAVLPLELPSLAGPGYEPQSACEPVEVPEPEPISVDPLLSVIQSAMPQDRLKRCYDRLLVRDPSGQGAMRYAVELDGNQVLEVRVLEDGVGEPEFARCTVDALERMRPFGVPQGRHQVVLPIRFDPR